MKFEDLYNTLPKKIVLIASAILGLSSFLYVDPFGWFVQNEERLRSQNIVTSKNESLANTSKQTYNEPVANSNISAVSLDLSKLYEFSSESEINKRKSEFEAFSAQANKELSLESKCLSYQSIVKIMDITFDLYSKLFYDLYFHARDLKRESINDINKYVQYFMQYDMGETERLLEDVSIAILQALKINERQYEESLMKASSYQPMIMYLPMMKIKQLRENIPRFNKKEVTFEEVEKFYEYQINVWDQYDNSLFGEGELQVQIKQTYVNDLACIETGIELEDFLKNQEIIKNPKFIELNKELLRKFGISDEMLANQANMMGGMM